MIKYICLSRFGKDRFEIMRCNIWITINQILRQDQIFRNSFKILIKKKKKIIYLFNYLLFFRRIIIRVLIKNLKSLKLGLMTVLE